MTSKQMNRLREYYVRLLFARGNVRVLKPEEREELLELLEKQGGIHEKEMIIM